MTLEQSSLKTALGWRARLGLIIPQLDLVSEPLFPRVLPEGVAVHTARMRRRGPVSSASLEQMNANIEAAIQLLPTPYIDATVYHCTMGSLLYDPEKLKREISALTGVPSITTTSSVISALQKLKAKNICLISPYVDELTKTEVAFFERAGFNVPHIGGEQIHDAMEMTRVAPEEINAWTRKAWHSECDAAFITCSGLRSHEFICELEAQLGAPVVTSTSAIVWEIYNYLKAPTAGVQFGKLFTTDHVV